MGIKLMKAGLAEKIYQRTALASALSLALMPTMANTINVDQNCDLVNAIIAANSDSIQGGCNAGSGADTIVLPANSNIILTEAHNTLDGGNGLPIINSHITIEGHHSIIQRSTALGTPRFRVFEVKSGNLTLKDTTITGGQADDADGVITSADCGGGAYIKYNSELHLIRSTISGNNAQTGAGVYASTYSRVFSENSTIANNNAQLVGGAFHMTASALELRNSTVSGNTAENGGGIDSDYSELLLENSTLSGNIANVDGGALHMNAGSVSMLHTTIANNEANQGGAGILVEDGQTSVSISNSIIATNDTTDCQFVVGMPLSVFGNNWFGDNSCQAPAQGNPLLVALSNNGGGTETHALQIGSGALNVVNDFCLPTDQRGVTRPQNSACDIGAYEKQVGVMPPVGKGDLGIQLDSISVSHEAQAVDFSSQTATSIPLIGTGPASFNGVQPGVVRVASQAGNPGHYTVRFQEYFYAPLDGIHALENVDIMRFNAGTFSLPDGAAIMSGTFDISGTNVWKKINFLNKFAGVPHVFVFPQTANGGQPVTDRVRNVTAASFEVALQEEEALNNSGHTTETMAFFAILNPAGQGEFDLGNGNSISYQLTQIEVNHQWTSVFGHLIKLEEEQSNDPERAHVKEKVDVMSVADRLFVQSVTHIGNDTFTIREKK